MTKIVGYWIKRFRQEKSGASMRGFAQMIGEDSGNQSKYENGKVIPCDGYLEKIAQELRLTDMELELLIATAQTGRILRYIERLIK